MIVTLTANPAIDVSTSVGEIVPTRKLRCTKVRRDPGGGGINAARVVKRLGGEVVAIYPAGGPIGQSLQRLVEREGLDGVPVAIAEETREDFTAVDEKSGEHYRFVLPGPQVSSAEWQDCLAVLERVARGAHFIVASGSLPPGVPDGFYVEVARIARRLQARLVLDTSGAPLAEALNEGVYLLKPSLRELRLLTGAPLLTQQDWLAACRSLVARGEAEVVALTLGELGALLVTPDAAFHGRAPDIECVSAVGAGDSFLGALVWALDNGGDLVTAFRYGVAAGSAAVLNVGTELCHASDVMRLRDEVAIQRFELQDLAAAS